MYCSSCGSAVAQNLSYCNHCGAGLSNAKDGHDSPPGLVWPESLVWAIVAVALGGLGIIIGLMAMMKQELNLSIGLILMFSLLAFSMVLATEGVLIWLLLSLMNSATKRSKTAQLKDNAVKGLGAAHPGALQEPLASVTEHSTRAFEPIYRERKAE